MPPPTSGGSPKSGLNKGIEGNLAALTSRVIDWVRFPLIVLVVSIHTDLGAFAKGNLENLPIANFFYNATAEGLARIAVPFFFFIAGYLFFFKASWSKNTYAGKIKKRLSTLVLPFLFWSTIALLYRLLAWKLGLARSDGWYNLSLGGWILAYFDIGAVPINGPLWFIRDLFCICLLSPILFWVIDKLKIWSLLLFGAFWVTSPFFWTLPCLSSAGFFFFCFGAYFSICKKDFVSIFSKMGVPAAILYPVILLCDVLTKNAAFSPYLHAFGILTGIVFVVFLVSKFLSKYEDSQMPKTLTNSVFFIYGAHALMAGTLFRIGCLLFPTATNFNAICVFCATIVIEIMVCLLAYCALRKMAPWSLKYTTGGR